MVMTIYINTSMKLSEIALGKSVEYNFYDIYDVVEPYANKPGVKIRLRKDRPAETRGKSGIYVWYHPRWGYFYVGIAAANNFVDRWHKHIQKLLDRCTNAKQMHNWKQFADLFAANGYSHDDLQDVILRFYPIADATQIEDRAQFKKELEKIETRIVKWLNPACNYQHDPDRPSSTYHRS